MLNMLDKFSITIFKDEDGDYGAYISDNPSISAFGDTIMNAIKELSIAFAAYEFSENKAVVPRET